MLAMWSLVLCLYKSILHIWKFFVHIVLKPSLENFEHYFASMWNECNCVVQFSSVAQSCPTLCNPMNRSMSGLPVHHARTPWTPRVDPNPCPSSRWCHSTISSCCPVLLPSVFLSIRVFSSESVLHISWPEYWSFSFSISLLMNVQNWFPLGWTGWISLQSKGPSRVFSNTTVQKHQFFSTLFLYSPTLPSIHDCWKNHSYD